MWPVGDRFVVAGIWNATMWRAGAGPLLTVQRHFSGDMKVFPAGDRVVAFVNHTVVVLWDAASGEVLQHLGTLRHPMYSGIPWVHFGDQLH